MYPFSRHSLPLDSKANRGSYQLNDAMSSERRLSDAHMQGYEIEGRTPGLLKRLALIFVCLGVLATPLYWAFAPNANDGRDHARFQDITNEARALKADRLPWPPNPNGPDRLALIGKLKQKSTARKSDRLTRLVEYGRKEARQLTALIKKLSPLPYLSKIIKPSIKAAKTRLVALKSSPFPYKGMMAATTKPFLNIKNGERQGHKTAFGRSYWADETYNDPRTLLHIPKRFNARAPGVMVVFFHGHGATLERDILKRQRVPEQISKSGMNAVLVAPQFAVDAKDSSAGKFWKPGALRRFVNEASVKLAKLHGDPTTAGAFKSMPVVIVAYSGGYVPAAYSVTHGGLKSRLAGVVLLDGLYGHLDKFAAWIRNTKSAFFLSAYARSTKRRNLKLKKLLAQENIQIATKLEPEMRPGSVTFISTQAKHRDFVTEAWTANPISDLLTRLGRITGQSPLRVSRLGRITGQSPLRVSSLDY